MTHKTILTGILTVASSVLVQAQSILGPGESRTWQFKLEYSSTVEVNSPHQSFGGHLILGYTHLAQAGPLDYRLDFFEDFTSTEPILSMPVHHLTGLQDGTGMPLIWLPEFTPPPDAWSDFDGVLRLTVESGQMQGLTPHISMLVPKSPGFMDYYQAVVVPEPGTLALMAVGGVLLFHRFRKRHV